MTERPEEPTGSPGYHTGTPRACQREAGMGYGPLPRSSRVRVPRRTAHLAGPGRAVRRQTLPPASIIGNGGVSQSHRLLPARSHVRAAGRAGGQAGTEPLPAVPHPRTCRR